MNNSISLFDLFLLDIETVPCCENFSNLPDEWKTLWIEKISKTMPENISHEESYWNKAGILAEFGKIICISTGYFFENKNRERCLKIKSIFGDDEKAVLEMFLQITGKVYHHNKNFQFAGHNIKEFDIPYICRRALINNISLPHYLYLHGAKPWEVRMIDTLQLWKFGDYKNYISLNLLAHVLQVPTSKTDMDGSRVRQVYYEEKNLQRIVEYCQRDVVVVGNIILRFNNLPLVKEENVMII